MRVRKNIKKGSPDEFMQAVNNKIQDLGGSAGSVESATAVTAGVSLSRGLQAVWEKINRCVGSRAGAQLAIIVNTGDGATMAVISEDENNGEEFYINYCQAQADSIVETEDDAANEIISLWADDVESCDNIEECDDTFKPIEATDEVPDDAFSEDAVKPAITDEIINYATDVGQRVVEMLKDAGMDADVTVVDNSYLQITIEDEPGLGDANSYEHILDLDAFIPEEDPEDDAEMVYENILSEIHEMIEGDGE